MKVAFLDWHFGVPRGSCCGVPHPESWSIVTHAEKWAALAHRTASGPVVDQLHVYTEQPRGPLLPGPVMEDGRAWSGALWWGPTQLH